MLTCFSFFFTTFVTIAARDIHIIIRDNVTQPCPGQHFELIDRKTINAQFELMPLIGEADHISLTGQSGNTRTITLPGCFRARLDFQLKKLVKNPYIESFIQLGTNIPCKVEDDELTNNVKQICTNITQANWCPQSNNKKLKSMLSGKNTWLFDTHKTKVTEVQLKSFYPLTSNGEILLRDVLLEPNARRIERRFCNLCQSFKIFDRDIESYVENEGPDQCNSTSLYKTFHLKICMLSTKQLREKNLHYDVRLREYWNYLKQGVLTAVVHILDRPQIATTNLQQCKRLCRTYENYPTIAESYRRALLQAIEELCIPADSYVACIYHTIKFDVIDS